MARSKLLNPEAKEAMRKLKMECARFRFVDL